MRRFELIDEKSAKFWQVEVDGGVVRVTYGRIGTDGKTSEKDLGDKAAREADKLIRQKTRKGYVEVSIGADPVAALKALGDDAFVHDPAYGELAWDEEPAIIATFMDGDDGAHWTKVLEAIDWVAVEADDGCVGVYRAGPEPVVLYLDNEGCFHVTGRTLIDHLAWIHLDGEPTELLAFCADHGFDGPMEEAAREALAATIPTPESVVETLRAAKARKKPKSTRAKKGPRPLARDMASCVLADGRVFVVTGEDFSKSYDQPITTGATFVFDPATSTFSTHTPLDDLPAGQGPAHALPLTDGSVLLVGRDWDGSPQARRWSERSGWSTVPSPPGRFYPGTALLPVGSGALLLGGGTSVAHFDGATWSAREELPDGRQNDAVLRVADGGWLLGGGELRTGMYSTKAATSTLRVSPEGVVQAGPTHEGPSYTRGPLVQRSDGAVFLVCERRLQALGDGDDVAAEELFSPGVSFQVGDALFTLRWKDDAVVRTDLFGGCEVVGAGRLPHSGSAAHGLADGRVLLVGGTAFANKDCEPELFDPAKGVFEALPGHDASVNRQVKALAKWRVKNP